MGGADGVGPAQSGDLHRVTMRLVVRSCDECVGEISVSLEAIFLTRGDAQRADLPTRRARNIIFPKNSTYEIPCLAPGLQIHCRFAIVVAGALPTFHCARHLKMPNVCIFEERGRPGRGLRFMEGP
ncbi:unnamed protein product, partial [Nesidiocoris tenuis]